jgi:hypothetical protein
MKWWWLLIIAFTGCSPLSKLVVSKPVSGRYDLRSDGLHGADALRIEAAVKAAHEGLERWGGVPEPVTIYLVGTHRDLERAVGLSGYDWLRAWTKRDNVIFQAPSTWDASDEALNQLMLHELTHSILFQRSGGATSWLIKNIPLWFREGMAVSNARQQAGYPSLEDTALWLSKNPDFDAFSNGDQLSRDHSREVYGFAVHAFEYLEEIVGHEKIEKFIDAIRDAPDFYAAFEPAIGMTLKTFQADFLTFLKRRTFRDARRLAPRDRIQQRVTLPVQQADPRPE